MIEKKIYTSSCPICARTLLKGTPDSCIEICCPKCREYVKIQFTREGYEACIIGQNQSDRAEIDYAEKR